MAVLRRDPRHGTSGGAVKFEEPHADHLRGSTDQEDKAGPVAGRSGSTRRMEWRHMPGSRKRKSKRAVVKGGPGLPQLRRGMPAQDSVQEVVDFVSPRGVPYKILKTTEVDSYDPPLRPRKKRGKPRGSSESA